MSSHGRAATEYREATGCPDIELPEPHPLDFDWRFTESTVGHLLDVCQSHSRQVDRLAILGAPTVLFEAAHRFSADRLSLIDQPNRTMNKLKYIMRK